MNIAYCDNELHCLKDFLTDFADIFINDDLKLYSTPDELLRLSPMPDIILMDIELGANDTGIDYAEKIRGLSPDTKIIFVTAYTEKFVQDAFIKDVNIKGFISKPIQRSYLRNMIDKLRSESAAENQRKITLTTKNALEIVCEASVLYAESSRHHVYVHTDNGSYEVKNKLSELNNALHDSFFMCHKSYIVNMDRITAFRRAEVELDSGDVIPVSRSHQQEFKDIYFSYIGKAED